MIAHSTTLIVGAGQCGATAAMALRDAGYSGRIVLLGDEAHVPYERPPLSKAVILDQVPTPVTVFDARRYESRQIEIRLGERALKVDAGRHILKTDREDIAYSRLLLTTGGRARVPEIPGADAESLLTLRTWDDALKLRERLVTAKHVTVVGGGLIGMEIAAVARQRQIEVTVVEAGSSILARALPASLSASLAQVHTERGVRVLLNDTIAQITKVDQPRSDQRYRVDLTSGASWETDVVLAGIGLIPDVALAESAGCALQDGILVDERGATNQPDIFAAGDCARFWHPALGRPARWETWHHAIRHGAHVAKCMLGSSEPYIESCRGWTEQYGEILQFESDATGTMQSVRNDAALSARFQAAAEGKWVRTVLAEELLEGAPLGCEVGGVDIALYRVGNNVFATHNVCTHGAARLSDGYQEGHLIECPLHQGQFDVRTGRCHAPPVTQDVASYPVRIAGEHIEVEMQD